MDQLKDDLHELSAFSNSTSCQDLELDENSCSTIITCSADSDSTPSASPLLLGLGRIGGLHFLHRNHIQDNDDITNRDSLMQTETDSIVADSEDTECSESILGPAQRFHALSLIGVNVEHRGTNKEENPPFLATPVVSATHEQCPNPSKFGEVQVNCAQDGDVKASLVIAPCDKGSLTLTKSLQVASSPQFPVSLNMIRSAGNLGRGALHRENSAGLPESCPVERNRNAVIDLVGMDVPLSVQSSLTIFEDVSNKFDMKEFSSSPPYSVGSENEDQVPAICVDYPSVSDAALKDRDVTMDTNNYKKRSSDSDDQLVPFPEKMRKVPDDAQREFNFSDSSYDETQVDGSTCMFSDSSHMKSSDHLMLPNEKQLKTGSDICNDNQQRRGNFLIEPDTLQKKEDPEVGSVDIMDQQVSSESLEDCSPRHKSMVRVGSADMGTLSQREKRADSNIHSDTEQCSVSSSLAMENSGSSTEPSCKTNNSTESSKYSRGFIKGTVGKLPTDEDKALFAHVNEVTDTGEGAQKQRKCKKQKGEWKRRISKTKDADRIAPSLSDGCASKSTCMTRSKRKTAGVAHSDVMIHDKVQELENKLERLSSSQDRMEREILNPQIAIQDVTRIGKQLGRTQTSLRQIATEMKEAKSNLLHTFGDVRYVHTQRKRKLYLQNELEKFQGLQKILGRQLKVHKSIASKLQAIVQTHTSTLKETKTRRKEGRGRTTVPQEFHVRKSTDDNCNMDPGSITDESSSTEDSTISHHEMTLHEKIPGRKTVASPSTEDSKTSRQEALLQELIGTLNESAGALLMKFMSIITGKGQEEGPIQDSSSTDSRPGTSRSANKSPLECRPGSAHDLDYAAQGDSSSDDDDDQEGDRSLPKVSGHDNTGIDQAAIYTATEISGHSSNTVFSVNEHRAVLQATAATTAASSSGVMSHPTNMTSSQSHPVASINVEPNVPPGQMPNLCSVSKRPIGTGFQYQMTYPEEATSTSGKSTQEKTFNMLPGSTPPNIKNSAKELLQTEGHGSIQLLQSNKVVKGIVIPFSKGAASDPRLQRVSIQSALPSGFSSSVPPGRSNSRQAPSLETPSMLPIPASNQFDKVPRQVDNESFTFCTPDRNLPQGDISRTEPNQLFSSSATSRKSMTSMTSCRGIAEDNLPLQHPTQTANLSVDQIKQCMPSLPWIPDMKSFKKIRLISDQELLPYTDILPKEFWTTDDMENLDFPQAFIDEIDAW